MPSWLSGESVVSDVSSLPRCLPRAVDKLFGNVQLQDESCGNAAGTDRSEDEEQALGSRYGEEYNLKMLAGGGCWQQHLQLLLLT